MLDQLDKTLLVIKLTKHGIRTTNFIETHEEKQRVLYELKKQFYEIKFKQKIG